MPSRLDLGLKAGMAMPGDTLASGPTINNPMLTTATMQLPTVYGYSFVLPEIQIGKDALTAFVPINGLLGRIGFASNTTNSNSSPFLNTLGDCARIDSFADEAQSATKGGARIVFSLCANGARVFTDRVFLTNDGKLGIGGTATSPNAYIDANGNIVTTGSIGTTGSRVVKGWFADLQVTNAIAGSVTGNAATATALATARNIDGQSFDGSAAITIIAPGTHAATSKGTPVDADELPLVDSAASNVLKKLTWANLKAALKTYFDGIYASSSSVSSVLYTKTTEVSTNATTNRTLSTYAVPAGTLSTNGDYLEVEYLLTCPSLATANNPTPTVSVGGVVMLGPSFSTQSGIVAYASGRMTITRLTSTTVRVAWIGNTTGLTTQPANWTAMYGSGADVTVSDLASNTLTVLLQGKNSAGTNSTAACMTQELTRITYNPGSALS